MYFFAKNRIILFENRMLWNVKKWDGISPINKELVGSFELAGEDKVFYPAVAKIQPDRRSIKVVSDQVLAPVAVRYGMRNWSEALIFNNFGIPASPFRSDDWEK